MAFLFIELLLQHVARHLSDVRKLSAGIVSQLDCELLELLTESKHLLSSKKDALIS
jgi:hypothetical protein